MVIQQQETGLAIYQPNMSVTELRQIAMDFAKSGYFQDAREAVQAIVKIQAGRELGFGPVYSMTKIYIVKGKVTVSAETMGAMIKRSGRYDYKVIHLDDSKCALQFFDSGKPDYLSTFTMEDAKRADLVKQDSGWAKWPRAMLMSKALSQGARIVCPHVISGTYTPEEFGLEPNSNGEYTEPKVTVYNSTDVIQADTAQNEAPFEQMATKAQITKLFSSAGQMNYPQELIKEILTRRYGKESTKDLTKKEISEFIDAIESGKHLTDQNEWA